MRGWYLARLMTCFSCFRFQKLSRDFVAVRGGARRRRILRAHHCPLDSHCKPPEKEFLPRCVDRGRGGAQRVPPVHSAIFPDVLHRGLRAQTNSPLESIVNSLSRVPGAKNGEVLLWHGVPLSGRSGSLRRRVRAAAAVRTVQLVDRCDVVGRELELGGGEVLHDA